MMDPPKVLLELSFLRAVHDTGHPQHELAVTEYLRLVSCFQREQVLLVGVSDHLQEFPGMDGPLRQIGLRRRGAFAPIDFLWVGFQHRRAARRAAIRAAARTAIAPELELDLDTALTLTMAQRHRITQVASLDPALDAYELELLPSRTIERDDGAGDPHSVITDSVDS